MCAAVVAVLTSGCANSIAKPANPVSPASGGTQASNSLTGAGLQHIMLAEFAWRRGNLADAANHWKKASELTRDPAVMAKATRFLAQQDRAGDALDMAKQWAAAAPDDLAPKQYWSTLLMREGRMKEGLALLRQSLKQKPEADKLYLQVASFLMDANQYRQAELVLNDFLEQKPTAASAYLALGQLHLRKRDAGKAMVAYQRALDLDAANDDAAVGMGQALLHLRGNENTRDFLSSFVKSSPDAPQSAKLLLALLVEDERWDEAFVLSEQQLQRNPDHPDFLVGRGIVEIRREQYQQAGDDLRHALNMDPDNLKAHYYLGEVYQQAKQMDEAAQHYDQVRQGTLALEAQMRLALIEHQTGDEASATKRLQMLENRFPTVVEIAMQRVVFALDKQQMDLALSLITPLVEQHKTVDLYYQRGDIYHRLGDYAAMERDMLETIRINPNYAQAYNYLGYSLVERGERLVEAETLLNRAIALAPDNPAIQDSIGWLRYKQGQHEQAEQILRKALEKMPEEPEVATHLGDVLWALGREDEARNIWTAAAKSNADFKPLQERLTK